MPFICSSQYQFTLKNFDNFNHLINKLKLEFDILGISESRILKSQSLNTNVNLQNYVLEQTSTESTAGGVLLYINRRHSYKTCRDLAIYKPKKLESVFVEVVLPKKSNFIVGCIYKHPCMDTCTFNDHYLNPLLDNLSKEANKTIVLLGDFNIDLLNFDTSEHVCTFLDDLVYNSLQFQILLPTRIYNNSKTLIDNIFCNIPSPLVKSVISGNISPGILDHLPQFFILPDFFSNSFQDIYGAMALWLRHWFPNAVVLCSKPLGASKVDSVFHPSEVNQMSTRDFWELSGEK